MNATIYTIGHSTRELDEFIEILQSYGINFLADVRTMPRSRRVPHFNTDTLPQKLAEVDIGYKHLEKLGGLRKTTAASPNKAWRNMSFRGYADYMQTGEFAEGIKELLSLAQDHTVAIMCAEAVPWRCHRSLVGDALLVRDITVIDIFNKKKSEPEKITSFAEVDGTTITYPEDTE